MARLAFLICFLCLIWPMHETFGEVGSCVSNPPFLLDFLRASSGIIDMIGPENPLLALCLFVLTSDLLSLPGLNVGFWKEAATAEAALGRNFKILFFGLP